MWARSVLVVGPTSCRAQASFTSPFWTSRNVLQSRQISKIPRLSEPARNRNAHSLIIVAHGVGHSHSGHSHTHSHDHEDCKHDHDDHAHHQDHDHDHEHDDHCHVEGFGHCHSDNSKSANWLHGLLISILKFTRLRPLLQWLEGSAFSSIAKIVLFLAAAGTSWAAGSGGRGAATVSTLRSFSVAAIAGVFFFAGAPAAVDLALDLSALRIDTHVLMNLAVIGTLVTGFPLEGALLLVLFQTSHAVEHLLTEKAQGNLQALYDAVPDHADVVQLDAEGAPLIETAQRVLAKQVALEDIMLVKPGTQVPLDGSIVYGRALVSVEHITGESLPSLKRQGDDIPAGALCHDGILAVKALRTAEDSTPARIARLARDAQAQRPQLRSWLEHFGEIYSKLVILATVVSLGVMVATGVPFLGSAGAERGALYRGMGLLTVASPCALVMVPLAYVSAIAAVASRGILLKGGRVFDALDRCRTVGVDKTGTLTTGRLAVTSMKRLELNGSGGGGGGGGKKIKKSQSVALEIAAALSLRSSHPVSDAIVEESVRKKVNPGSIRVSDFQLVAGGGVMAMIENIGEESQPGYEAYFGSIDYISSQLSGEQVEALRRAITSSATNGRSNKGNENIDGSSTISILVLKSSNDSAALNYVWMFTLEDTLRSVSAAAVSALQKGSWAGPQSTTAPAVPSRACHVVMLTGDNEASAARIADKLGIDHVMSGLNPEDKLREIGTLRITSSQDQGVGINKKNKKASRRSGVIMVGDGLNDAAALATADVGIAIASNTTAAATLAADAVVINEGAGMAAVPLLLRIARATRYVVAQNLILAFGSIVVLAGPTVLGFMPLWLAVMLHEGSTLLVALNSLRLLRFSSVLGAGKEREGHN